MAFKRNARRRSLPNSVQNDIATLDLILMEVVEGLRPESELRNVAERLVHLDTDEMEGRTWAHEAEVRRP
jgi:hypothetical protein